MNIMPTCILARISSLIWVKICLASENSPRAWLFICHVSHVFHETEGETYMKQLISIYIEF